MTAATAAQVVHMQFPNLANYEAALILEAGKWASNTGNGVGKWRPEVVDVVQQGQVKLTNAERQPDAVMRAALHFVEQIIMAEVVAEALGALNAAADQECTSPDCPVHGERNRQRQNGATDPDNLDTAFGIGEWEL